MSGSTEVGEVGNSSHPSRDARCELLLGRSWGVGDGGYASLGVLATGRQVKLLLARGDLSYRWFKLQMFYSTDLRSWCSGNPSRQKGSRSNAWWPDLEWLICETAKACCHCLALKGGIGNQAINDMFILYSLAISMRNDGNVIAEPAQFLNSYSLYFAGYLRITIPQITASDVTKNPLRRIQTLKRSIPEPFVAESAKFIFFPNKITVWYLVAIFEHHLWIPFGNQPWLAGKSPNWMEVLLAI